MIIRIPIYIYVIIFGFTESFGQTDNALIDKQKDSTETFYYIIEGDTIAREMINLDEVYLLKKVKFMSEKDRRRYLIL